MYSKQTTNKYLKEESNTCDTKKWDLKRPSTKPSISTCEFNLIIDANMDVMISDGAVDETLVSALKSDYKEDSNDGEVGSQP